MSEVDLNLKRILLKTCLAAVWTDSSMSSDEQRYLSHLTETLADSEDERKALTELRFQDPNEGQHSRDAIPNHQSYTASHPKYVQTTRNHQQNQMLKLSKPIPSLRFTRNPHPDFSQPALSSQNNLLMTKLKISGAKGSPLWESPLPPHLNRHTFAI